MIISCWSINIICEHKTKLVWLVRGCFEVCNVFGGYKAVIVTLISQLEIVLLSHWRRCWKAGRTSRAKATWRVAEELTSRWSALIMLWIDSIASHIWNPCHPLGLQLSVSQSIVLVSSFPWHMCFFCSYLSIFVIWPTFIPILFNPYLSDPHPLLCWFTPILSSY